MPHTGINLILAFLMIILTLLATLSYSINIRRRKKDQTRSKPLLSSPNQENPLYRETLKGLL